MTLALPASPHPPRLPSHPPTLAADVVGCLVAPGVGHEDGAVAHGDGQGHAHEQELRLRRRAEGRGGEGRRGRGGEGEEGGEWHEESTNKFSCFPHRKWMHAVRRDGWTASTQWI